MERDPIVVVSAVRTPLGAFAGAFKDTGATVLGARAIAATLERGGIAPDAVSEVLMGCVLPAGLGQAPARQAALGGGLARSTPCTTISKVCGSGMKAIMLGADMLAAGSAISVIAGGMESMSNAPYLLDRARHGQRLGHGRVLDHMFLDGLEDAYDKGRLMGVFAEETAAHFGFTREEQDGWALTSLERSRAAQSAGAFDDERIPVLVEGKIVAEDEGPAKAKPERIRTLKPAFRTDGTVTAANASSISDGAAALLLMRMSDAEKSGLRPIAKLVGHAGYAAAPAWFTTAPVGAVSRLLDRIGWKMSDVDLFEINEAFAVVVLAAIRELRLAPDLVNVHGGACALGHPIGASGARIVVTLLSALRRRGARRGIASLCIGGGEATALAVEMI